MMNIHEAYMDYAATLPDDPSIQRRLRRAYAMLKTGSGYAITPTHSNVRHMYTVHKLSTALTGEDTYYNVINNVCSCPDYDNAPGQLCKHVMAIKLMERVDHD